MSANDYNQLTLSERCDGMRDARREAIDDAVRGEKLNPYSAPDPRYYAYEQGYGNGAPTSWRKAAIRLIVAPKRAGSAR